MILPEEGSVYASSGPSDLGWCIICLLVGVEVMVPFFMLFVVVVLRAASSVDGPRLGKSCWWPALGDRGDVPPAVFTKATRLWSYFLP